MYKEIKVLIGNSISPLITLPNKASKNLYYLNIALFLTSLVALYFSFSAFSIISFSGIICASFGLIIELIYFLEKRLKPAKSRLLKFIVFPMILAGLSIIAFTIADWFALEMISQITKLNPQPYTRTAQILIIPGFLISIVGFVAMAFTLCGAFIMLLLILVFIVDTAINFVYFMIGKQRSLLVPRWVVINFGRYTGLVSVSFLCIAFANQSQYLKIPTSWIIYTLDHYTTTACFNIDLNAHEKILYINDNRVSVATWNGFNNPATFRLADCQQ